MKIALDVSQTCQERAGCAWYADSLANAMMRHVPENKYILYHQFGDWHNDSTDRGTTPIGKKVETPFLNTNSRQSRDIWRKIVRGESLPGAPDIVHSTSFQAPKLRGTKLVFTIYDFSFWTVPEFTTEANRLACQKGMLQALQNADGFAFISQSTKNEFDKFFPNWLVLSGKPWAITPLGHRVTQQTDVIFDFEKKLIKPQSYWLSVGSLEPRKNIGTLLDAHEIYWLTSSCKYPLVIAGGGGWKSEKIKMRIQELEARNRVISLGYVSDKFLPQLYSQATALVFPSLYEGFGLPILEALNNGCPVLAGRNSSLSEVAGDAVLTIDPLDSHSIANAMLTLEATPILRNSLKTRGMAQSLKFSWKITSLKTMELYASVIKGKPEKILPQLL